MYNNVNVEGGKKGCWEMTDEVFRRDLGLGKELLVGREGRGGMKVGVLIGKEERVSCNSSHGKRLHLGSDSLSSGLRAAGNGGILMQAVK